MPSATAVAGGALEYLVQLLLQQIELPNGGGLRLLEALHGLVRAPLLAVRGGLPALAFDARGGERRGRATSDRERAQSLLGDPRPSRARTRSTVGRQSFEKQRIGSLPDLLLAQPRRPGLRPARRRSVRLGRYLVQCLGLGHSLPGRRTETFPYRFRTGLGQIL